MAFKNIDDERILLYQGVLLCQRIYCYTKISDGCETEMHMAVSKLIWVRLATPLRRNKYARILSDVIRQYTSELSRFYFNVLDVCLALNTALAKKT